MKLLWQTFKKGVKTQTIKDTSIVFAGQAASTLISALFFILIARILGPEKLGIYSIITALVIIVTDTVDIAINSAIVKFGLYKEKDSYLKFAFILKIIFGSFFSILIFLGSGIFSLLLRQNLNEFLKIAALWILATFLFRFPKAFFQSQKKFLRDALMDLSLSLIRMIITLLIIYLNKFSISALIYMQIAVTFLIAFGAIKIISLDFLRAEINEKIIKKFFSFHGWLTLGFILAAIHSRIDNFLLMHFVGPTVVGLYQAGYRFFLPVSQFASILSTIFAPRFASFQTQIQVKNYLKKATMLSGALASLLLLAIAFLPWLIKIFYGERYVSAILPTQILAIGFAAFIFTVPFTTCLIYRMGKTNFFALLNLLQLILIIVLDLLLIPKFAANGAALAMTLTLFLINLLTIFWVIKK